MRRLKVHHAHTALDAQTYDTLAHALLGWRQVLLRLTLIGQIPTRYDNVGFGNLSVRHGQGFLITGTQTGSLSRLTLAELCVVERWNVAACVVHSHGEMQPSSESLTHGAVYDLDASIGAVFHAHSPAIWRAREALALPTTCAEVPYGTDAMAEEMQRLWRDTDVSTRKVLAMAGHEDGVLAIGESVDAAGQALVSTLARALG